MSEQTAEEKYPYETDATRQHLLRCRNMEDCTACDSIYFDRDKHDKEQAEA